MEIKQYTKTTQYSNQGEIMFLELDTSRSCKSRVAELHGSPDESSVFELSDT